MNNTQIEKMVNYFTIESNITEIMPINYFCNKIYTNCGIDSNKDENIFIRKYIGNEYIIKSDYRDLINEIINLEDGINKIEKIIEYFNISEYIGYNKIDLTAKTIQMISLFISGKLIQYNARDNLIKFNKYLLKYFPEEFNIKELEFTYQLAGNFNEKYYFIILDDLLSNNNTSLILNNTLNQLLIKYEGGKAFIYDYNIKNEIEMIKGFNNDIKPLKEELSPFNKLSKFFSGQLANSEVIEIKDFIDILNNIDINDIFLSQYKIKYGHMKVDYNNLFSQLYRSENGHNKIYKILDYFELSKGFVNINSLNIKKNLIKKDNNVKKEKYKKCQKQGIFGFIKKFL